MDEFTFEYKQKIESSTEYISADKNYADSFTSPCILMFYEVYNLSVEELSLQTISRD